MNEVSDENKEPVVKGEDLEFSLEFICGIERTNGKIGRMKDDDVAMLTRISDAIKAWKEKHPFEQCDSSIRVGSESGDISGGLRCKHRKGHEKGEPHLLHCSGGVSWDDGVGWRIDSPPTLAGILPNGIVT